MKLKNLFKTGLVVLSLGAVVSCTKDDETSPSENGKYNTEVAMTDAPIDDANVKAAFITVADVKVDGQSLEGFQKTTIEISSLTNGETQTLGNIDLASGAKSDIVLVLASDTDASGNAPANYIVTANDETKALVTVANEISINDSFNVEEANDNKMVLDFDLRKAIVAEGSTGYKFVSNSELSNSVRVVNEINAGTISGSVTGDSSAKTVVYAYKKGAFSASESQSNGSGVKFENAVSSTVVSGSDFGLHFMEAGDYELHFASYSDSDSDGKLEFNGLLNATTASDLNVLNLAVGANAEVNLNIIISGFLDI
jgi:hypothetical protein